MTVDPPGLRAAAGALDSAGVALHDVAARVRSAGTLAGAQWTGAASLLMAAHVRELAITTDRLGDELCALGSATAAHAVRAERCLAELGAVQLRSAPDRSPTAAAAVQTDPVMVARRDAVLADLAASSAVLARRLEATDPLTERGLALGSSLVVGATGWAGAGWLRSVHTARRWAVADAAATAHVRTAALLHLRGATDAATQATTRATLARWEAGRAAYAFAGRSFLADPPRSAPVRLWHRLAMPLTVYGGVQDARTGGGHGGARGLTTRVLGAAGAAGAGWLTVAPLALANPVGLSVAGGAVLLYGAWSLGTMVVDHWPDISAFGRRAWAGQVAYHRWLSGQGRRLVTAGVAGVRRAAAQVSAGAQAAAGAAEQRLRAAGRGLDEAVRGLARPLSVPVDALTGLLPW